MRATPQSLVGRLVFAFLLPSLVILVLGAVAAYLGATATLRQSVFERLDAIATVKESALDTWVEHLSSEVVLLSELPEVAEVASELVAGAIAERGVEVEIAPDLPAVHGDRARLVELVQNLIENAVRYMGDQPSPRLEVGHRRDGSEVVFTVRDNGIGIERRYHEKVFGLFERLDPQATEGTGVGLALVKRIVEVHGGRAWVESEGEGKGSTFCFTLSAEPGYADEQRPGAADGTEPLL